MAIRITRTPKLFSVAEVAKRERVTTQRVRELCHEGRIAGAVKVGGTWVIDQSYVILARRPGRGPRGFAQIGKRVRR
jgi:hypothetical protein